MSLTKILCLLAACLVAPLAALAQEAPVRSSIVAFGLWDAQRVFQLEASRGAGILAKDFAAGQRVLVRANTPRHPDASKDALAQVLVDAASKLDGARDVLFLLLTSHGSAEGIAVRIAGRVELLPPSKIAAMLAATGVKHKVVIVSACYSGIFADALADADTLVITAADASHPSFGCTNSARWTWFGQAFFAEALQRTRSLPQAFAQAKASIAKRERAQGFDPSNPQMRGGEAVLPLLERLAN